MTFTRANRSALFALVAAGLIWGLTVPLSKVALGWLDPAWLTAARFSVAAPVLALIGRRRLREALTPAIMAWGATGYGMVIILQNLGIERTSVSHAALILGAVPALVALTAAGLGRSSSGPVAWAGFAVALAGVGLIAGSGGSSSGTGDLLVLASGVLSALYIVAQRPLLEGRDAVAVTAVQMGVAAAVAFVVALLWGQAPAGAPGDGALVATIVLATFGSVLPYALYAHGQAHVEAEVAGAFVNLEPLVGASIGAMAFGEPFGLVHVIGTVAILGGILLSLDLPRMGRGAPAAAAG
jgi:drug/metabolite transporter (DMT)-like permease